MGRVKFDLMKPVTCFDSLDCILLTLLGEQNFFLIWFWMQGHCKCLFLQWLSQNWSEKKNVILLRWFLKYCDWKKCVVASSLAWMGFSTTASPTPGAAAASWRRWVGASPIVPLSHHPKLVQCCHWGVTSPWENTQAALKQRRSLQRRLCPQTLASPDCFVLWVRREPSGFDGGRSRIFRFGGRKAPGGLRGERQQLFPTPRVGASSQCWAAQASNLWKSVWLDSSQPFPADPQLAQLPWVSPRGVCTLRVLVRLPEVWKAQAGPAPHGNADPAPLAFLLGGTRTCFLMYSITPLLLVQLGRLLSSSWLSLPKHALHFSNTPKCYWTCSVRACSAGHCST